MPTFTLGRQSNRAPLRKFGFKPGQRNNGPALQKALDYLRDNVGGRVELPIWETIWTEDEVTAWSRCGIVCEGGYPNTSVIKALPGSGLATILKLGDQGGADPYWHGGLLQGFSIDGNKANGGATDGIDIGRFGETSLVKQVYVKNCTQDGIRTDTEATPVTLESVSCFDNGRWGLNLDNFTRHFLGQSFSGDSNGEALVRINGTAAGHMGSATFTAIKGENNPIGCLVDDYLGSVQFIGGSLDGRGLAGSAVVRRTGNDQGTINFVGLRAGGYATQFDDQSVMNADINYGGVGTTWTLTDTIGGSNTERTRLSNGIEIGKTARLIVDLGGKIVSLGGATVTLLAGAGSPEAVWTAPVGSLYLRTDGVAGTLLYSKQTGAGNVGWVAID